MKKIYFFLLFTIPTFLVFFWFRHGNIMGGGESGLPFYDLSRQYEISRYSWADAALGNSVGIGTAAIPFFKAISSIQSLGIPGFVMEASFFWIILVTSGISIRLLTKELFPYLEEKYLLLSAFFYWFNPISLVNIWNRFLYNYMVFFALLPLAFYLFLKGIRTKNFLYSILVGLACGSFSYALTSTPLNILVWFLFSFTIAFYLIISESREERIFLLRYIILTLLYFVLLNFWWISQLFALISSSDFATTTSAFFTSTGNLSTLTALSDRLGRFSNTFRFMHATFGPEWAKVFNAPLLELIEFSISGIIWGTIYKFRRRKEVLLFGGLFIFSLFLIKGNSEPFGRLFQVFFLKFPVLQVFRNPFEKFGFLLQLVAAPLFVFGVDRLSEGIKNIRFRNFFFGGVYASTLLFWGFPFWTGLVFTSNEATFESSQRTYEVKVPSYYQEANSWFIKNASNFRFISLPVGGEAINYNWEKPYAGVELSSTLFTTPNISFNTTISYYDSLVTELSRHQLDKGFLNFLPFVNGRYIVWRGDIDFKQRQMADPSVVRRTLDELVKERLIIKRFEAGKLAIYELNGNLYWPKVYATSEVYISNTKDLAFLSSFFDRFPEKKISIIDESLINKEIRYKKAVYVPDNVYFQKVSLPLPKNLTDEQLLGRLFYAKHLPGEIVYPLIRLNEKILELKEKDPNGWMLYKLGILGKRVAEIYKLIKLGKNTDLVVSTQKDYERELSFMAPSIVGLIKEGGPVAGVIRNSLIYQWILLERAGSITTPTLLSDLLSKWDIKPTFELPPSNSSYMVASFKLPADGNYVLYGINKQIVFLDGRKQAIGQNKPLVLKSGVHEVSLNLGDSEIFKNVVDNPNEIFIDESNSQHWNFEIPITQRSYRVDFDYRFVRGELFGAKIVQDLENKTNPSFNKYVKKNPLYHGWTHFDEEMTSVAGATKAYLTFNSQKESFCEKLWWGWNKCGVRDSQFEIEIKNLKVREIVSPKLAFVMSKEGFSESVPSNVTFAKVDPTFYKVHVDKKSATPEVLVFSELYNSFWKLSSEDGKKSSDSLHLLVNGYANGWIITKEGSYDLSINFEPENVLKLGKKASTFTVVAGIILLILFVLRRRENEFS